MPNHVHGIITISEESRGGVLSPPNGQNQNNLHRSTLGQIIAYFKYQSTKDVNFIANTGTITKLWQRNYYEHIIRNADDHNRTHLYIKSNPSMWETDNENPAIRTQ